MTAAASFDHAASPLTFKSLVQACLLRKIDLGGKISCNLHNFEISDTNNVVKGNNNIFMIMSL